MIVFDKWQARQIQTDLPPGEWPTNIWPGVTVCNQDEVWKTEELLKIPAKIRWVSIEPMLGPVDLSEYFYHGHGRHVWDQTLNWVVLGGESRPGASPLHPDWVRSVRDQCQAAVVPFFFKNWGSGSYEWRKDYRTERDCDWKKKLRGRLLDGRTYDAFPEY